MVPGPDSCSQNSKTSRHHQHCPNRGWGWGLSWGNVFISQLKLEGFALMADMVYVTQVRVG